MLHVTCSILMSILMSMLSEFNICHTGICSLSMLKMYRKAITKMYENEHMFNNKLKLKKLYTLSMLIVCSGYVEIKLYLHEF